jgi:FtsH-binding integral membrane protein
LSAAGFLQGAGGAFVFWWRFFGTLEACLCVMRPSPNSLIARRPVFTFALVNGAGLFFSLLMYFSEVPANLVLASAVATLVLTNAMLVILRLRIPRTPAETAAAHSTQRTWLLLVAGVGGLSSGALKLAHPIWSYDMALGTFMLVCALGALWAGWRSLYKRPPE